MSQTSSNRPASSTTAAVNHALAELRAAAAGGADARPQYTLTSATARPPPGLCRVAGLMLPGKGSVAPVHDAGDLADYRAPAERCGFCPDFLQSPAGEEAAEPARFT